MGQKESRFRIFFFAARIAHVGSPHLAINGVLSVGEASFTVPSNSSVASIT